jgi:predicted nucleotidyltransferase component of viral defense system
MGTTTALSLTPDRALHVQIMQAMAHDFHDLQMVLKGGTALLLCYGLDRFSEDLDFDSPKKFNIKQRVENTFAKFCSSYEVKTVKDTATVQRLKSHYQGINGDRLLKIETSFRQAPSPDTVVIVNGIRTYTISTLIDQKIQALIGRTAARDLYDVAFLARTYRSDFSVAAIQMLTAIMADVDAVEYRFMEAFEEDELMDEKMLPELILQISSNLSHP